MSALFEVAIPTRNRPMELARTLDALDAQSDRDFAVLIVAQGEEPPARNGVRVIHDDGRGLSRARNIATRALDAEWIVFMDDDCLPDRDWAAELRAVLESDPPVELVTGPIAAVQPPDGAYDVDELPVPGERTLAGPRIRPWEVAFGVSFAIRRSAIERLGGFDERLGAGSDDFPASEDMDLNWRLTRSGGSVLHTPRPRVVHHPPRDAADLPQLYYGYSRGWAGFAVKHRGNGGLLLWGARAKGIAKAFGKALRRRSAFRARLAWQEARGLASGTVSALRRSW
jgi:GT2 family glycosyltransferase